MSQEPPPLPSSYSSRPASAPPPLPIPQPPLLPQLRRTRVDLITEKQYNYILALGGVPDEEMMRAEASAMIDDLLEEQPEERWQVDRPVTPRQLSVLRFWGEEEEAEL